MKMSDLQIYLIATWGEMWNMNSFLWGMKKTKKQTNMYMHKYPSGKWVCQETILCSVLTGAPGIPGVPGTPWRDKKKKKKHNQNRKTKQKTYEQVFSEKCLDSMWTCLHLFHPCHFLRGPLEGPLVQGDLEDLEEICQAVRFKKKEEKISEYLQQGQEAIWVISTNISLESCFIKILELCDLE